MVTFTDYLLQLVCTFCIGYFFLKKRDAALLYWVVFVPIFCLAIKYLFINLL